MKCPACHFVCSDSRDLCPRCLLDLRDHKKNLNLRVSNPDVSYKELLRLVVPKGTKEQHIKELRERPKLLPSAKGAVQSTAVFLGQVRNKLNKHAYDSVNVFTSAVHKSWKEYKQRSYEAQERRREARRKRKELKEVLPEASFFQSGYEENHEKIFEETVSKIEESEFESQIALSDHIQNILDEIEATELEEVKDVKELIADEPTDEIEEEPAKDEEEIENVETKSVEEQLAEIEIPEEPEINVNIVSESIDLNEVVEEEELQKADTLDDLEDFLDIDEENEELLLDTDEAPEESLDDLLEDEGDSESDELELLEAMANDFGSKEAELEETEEVVGEDVQDTYVAQTSEDTVETDSGDDVDVSEEQAETEEQKEELLELEQQEAEEEVVETLEAGEEKVDVNDEEVTNQASNEDEQTDTLLDLEEPADSLECTTEVKEENLEEDVVVEYNEQEEVSAEPEDDEQNVLGAKAPEVEVAPEVSEEIRDESEDEHASVLEKFSEAVLGVAKILVGYSSVEAEDTSQEEDEEPQEEHIEVQEDNLEPNFTLVEKEQVETNFILLDSQESSDTELLDAEELETEEATVIPLLPLLSRSYYIPVVKEEVRPPLEIIPSLAAISSPEMQQVDSAAVQLSSSVEAPREFHETQVDPPVVEDIQEEIEQLDTKQSITNGDSPSPIPITQNKEKKESKYNIADSYKDLLEDALDEVDSEETASVVKSSDETISAELEPEVEPEVEPELKQEPEPEQEQAPVTMSSDTSEDKGEKAPAAAPHPPQGKSIEDLIASLNQPIVKETEKVEVSKPAVKPKHNVEPEVSELFDQLVADAEKLDSVLEFDLGFENIADSTKREDVLILFELSDESLINPDFEKRFEKEEKMTDETQKVESKSLKEHLKAAEKFVDLPKFSLRSMALKSPKKKISEPEPEPFEPADLDERTSAGYIDFIIVAFGAVVLTILYCWFGESTFFDEFFLLRKAYAGDMTLLVTIYFISLIVFTILYQWIGVGYYKQTFGLQSRELVVLRENGLPLKPANTAIRAIVFPISIVLGAPLRLMKGKNTIHDDIARTTIGVWEEPVQDTEDS